MPKESILPRWASLLEIQLEIGLLQRPSGKASKGKCHTVLLIKHRKPNNIAQPDCSIRETPTRSTFPLASVSLRSPHFTTYRQLISSPQYMATILSPRLPNPDITSFPVSVDSSWGTLSLFLAKKKILQQNDNATQTRVA